MAKLRRNHTSRGGAAAGTTIFKVTVFALILFGLIWAFHKWDKGAGARENGPSPYAGERYYLPTGGSGPLVHHGGFTLRYDEEWEQAAWVAYLLEGKNLDREWARREDNFRADPAVRTGSASPEDYRGSGYDRGHLAPFADFAWNAQYADETFLLSNVSPQAPQFNQGIWRELEELVRDWARGAGRLYVVTGPVRSEPPKGHVGRQARVPVPQAYFKVLLDLEQPEQKGIAFLIPNAVSFRPLPEYTVSIDSVERLTGFDFFPELMPRDLEEQLERASNPDLWPFSNKKFDRRVGVWNQVQ